MAAQALIAEIAHGACRFALLQDVESGRPLFSHRWEEPVGPTSDIMEIIQRYLDGLDQEIPKALSVAVAAPVSGDRFTITSSGWTSSGQDLRDRFGFERVLMLNETAARGLSLGLLSPEEVIAVGGSRPLRTPLQPGRYALVSPDIGLGCCYVQVREDGSYDVVGTEGGHMAFPARSDFEISLLRRLTAKYGRVSYERVISWSGLGEIHAALCADKGLQASGLTPLEIVLYSRTGADPFCVEAVNRFYEILGDYAGDVALTVGAEEGVFLTGRFMMEAHEAIETSGFRARFEAKGRLTGVVQNLPTWAITSRASVLVGMARHFIDTRGDDAAGRAFASPAPAAPVAPAAPAGIAQSLLDGAAAGLLLLDANLRVVSGNARYWEGSSVPERLRQPGGGIDDCLKTMAEGHDISVETTRSVLAQFGLGQPFSVERQAFGGRFLRDEARPVSDGWVITAHDVTASRRRALELEAITTDLRAAKTAAEAANGAKTSFLATMSHEIRTPLNGVLGMAQAMAIDILSPQQAGRLEIIRQSGENLLAILNDILDLSKIEAGKLELEEVEFDLEQLLMGAHSTFTALANKKGLSFCLATDQTAQGLYRGDPTRLRQILYNLVSNAIKFTETGEVRVTTTFDGASLSMTVADTGIGIPQDRVDSLFEKFMQVDASTTRQYGGTGLGLAICRDLAHLLGGQITVRSLLGKGTTFELCIPLDRLGDSQAGAGFAVEDAIEPANETGALRVLAAEDNSVNQLVLKTLLSQMGVEVTVVDDGEQAVAAWEAEEWDVVLMDVQMPKMDGPTAVRMIREKERATGRRRTPIVALTANVMTHQINEYLDAGMDAYVGKPLQISTLIEAIVKVTDEAAETSAAA